MKILKRQFFIKIIIFHDRMDFPGSYYMCIFEYCCSFGENFIELASSGRKRQSPCYFRQSDWLHQHMLHVTNELSLD